MIKFANVRVLVEKSSVMCGEKVQRARSMAQEVKNKELKGSIRIVIDRYFLRRYRVEDW